MCVAVRACACIDVHELFGLVRCACNKKCCAAFCPKLNIWGCATIIYINRFIYMKSTMSEKNKSQKKALKLL